MTAPAVSPRAMTNRPTNTTASGGRLMRLLFASIGKRVGPPRAEGIRPASPVSIQTEGPSKTLSGSGDQHHFVAQLEVHGLSASRRSYIVSDDIRHHAEGDGRRAVK